MGRADILEFLNLENILTVTREQLIEDMDNILEQIDRGSGPVMVIAEGKPDLMLFAWEDYKRRFSMIYPPDEFKRLENMFKENCDGSRDK